MKTYILALIGLLLAIASCAKEPIEGYKKFYREYRDSPNVTSFKVPAGLASFIIDDEDKEAKEFLKNMDDISFLILKETNNQMIFDLNKNLPEQLYKEIMVIKDGGSEVTFLARDNGKTIEEILMTVVDNDEIVIMCMTGSFTKEDAKRIVKSINVQNVGSLN
ncbi:MAG: DUF4252 domain-containing protein [Salinivirgaceae bacterium]